MFQTLGVSEATFHRWQTKYGVRGIRGRAGQATYSLRFVDSLDFLHAYKFASHEGNLTAKTIGKQRLQKSWASNPPCAPEVSRGNLISLTRVRLLIWSSFAGVSLVFRFSANENKTVRRLLELPTSQNFVQLSPGRSVWFNKAPPCKSRLRPLFLPVKESLTFNTIFAVS